MSWSEVDALVGEDSSDAGFEASTRASIPGILACAAHKLVGVSRVEIDLLALRNQIALILDIEH